MTPRSPNLEAREKILKAAFALIHERGFNAVSMDDVAAAAGLKKANLFHYYPTKEQLGVAVFDHAARQMRERVSAQLEKGGDPIRLVEGMFTELSKGMESKKWRGGCPIGNLAQELSDQSERIRKRIAEHLGEWTAALARRLETARSEGYFRKDLEPKCAAQAILSLFEGATLFCKAEKCGEPLESAKDMAVGYLKAHKR